MAQRAAGIRQDDGTYMILNPQAGMWVTQLGAAIGVTLLLTAGVLLWLGLGKRSHQDRSAEPAAALKGGPATRLESSSLTEGPPSVS